MILRTTKCRLSRMWKVMDELEDYDVCLELSEVLTRGEAPVSKAEGEICYAAGIVIRDALIARCYTDRKTLERGLSSSYVGALKDITHATNEEARHPALRGVGLLGHHARIFHVWYVGDELWSPFPIEGAPFEILYPAWHLDDRYPSEKFTVWESDANGAFGPPSRLDDEALHRHFVSSWRRSDSIR